MESATPTKTYQTGIIALGVALLCTGTLALCSLYLALPLRYTSGMILPIYCITLGLELVAATHMKREGKDAQVRLGFIFLSVIVLCIINLTLHIPGAITAFYRLAYLA